MNIRGLFLFFVGLGMGVTGAGQEPAVFFAGDAVVKAGRRSPTLVYHPLQSVFVRGGHGSRVVVRDGAGKAYFRGRYSGESSFVVLGALGVHTVSFYDEAGRCTSFINFQVDASTSIDDGARYKALFDLLYKSMCVYSATGVDSIDYNGKMVHYFVPWGLDNYNTMKGIQYFSKVGKELTDVFAEQQRKDGMIWSFIASNKDNDYFKTAYSPYGFFREDRSVYFVRQPTENHVEYIFVNTLYKCWKASGDMGWLQSRLPAAERALEYSVHDPLRWSERFGLLKRALTIDSWDFQVDDMYTPQLGIGNAMLVDAKKTKFGIFYGDNTGYAHACRELAEMYDSAGNHAAAERFRRRAAEIMQRLNGLSWNGHFFTHFIDEDPGVHRDLGVDMASQLSQSNAYSLNRGLPYAQDTAILNAYLGLRAHLPEGGPAEWYAIYPPFGRGFGAHDALWQYMNGGVGGHVAGELALGAFENGYEGYGVDILRRLDSLGQKYGGRVWFAYTGSFPSLPDPGYKTVDLGAVTNMSMRAGKVNGSIGFLGDSTADGNDLAGMPAGDQRFAGIPFHIAGVRDGRAVVAVSSRAGYPRSVAIPINDTAACVYLLHDASGSEDVVGEVRFVYADNSGYSIYIRKGLELGSWWFPGLQQDQAGVAWSGPNGKSSKVGIYWAAVRNPEPGKTIREIQFRAADNDAVYAVAGVTLADRMHAVRAKGESFGGPDNWAAATGMAALIEGLAGVKDSGLAYRRPVIAPRWNAAGVDTVAVTARYAVSEGYVAYQFRHDRAEHRIIMQITGNAGVYSFHVLLPDNAIVRKVISGPVSLRFRQRTIGYSNYLDFTTDAAQSSFFIQY